MKLLSISLPRHDASVSYFDGENLYYLKLERLKQIKGYTPIKKIRHTDLSNYRYEIYNDFFSWKYDIQNTFNIDFSELDEIVFDFHIENFYDEKFIPNDLNLVRQGIKNACKIPFEENIFEYYIDNQNLYYIGHHYAHSLSSWMLHTTPDVSIVIDGVGDGRTWSVFRNKSEGSIGGAIGNMAMTLGIRGQFNDLAGKLMSLISYVEIDKEYLNILKQYNYRQISKIFDFNEWIKFNSDSLVAEKLSLVWAATVHRYMEDVLVDMFKRYAQKNEIISYSGGVAQNIIWNRKLKKSFPNLIIPPHSADEGLSLGGIEWLRKKNNLEPFVLKNFPYSQYDKKPDSLPTEETIKFAAQLLSEGNIIGWYQENGEIGPRALGNRSILMDPRIKDGKFQINEIKKRENYRPFGASVLEENAKEISDIEWSDDFMIYACNLKNDNLHSICHIDGSCRLQTVSKNCPSSLRKLLEEFYRITDCPCLLNTSLNLDGYPIAGFEEIAIKILNDTKINYVFIGNKCYKSKN